MQDILMIQPLPRGGIRDEFLGTDMKSEPTNNYDIYILPYFR